MERRTASSWRAAAGGSIAALTLRQSDPSGEGRLWPQRLRVTLGSADGTESFQVALEGESAEVEAQELRLLGNDLLSMDDRGWRARFDRRIRSWEPGPG